MRIAVAVVVHAGHVLVGRRADDARDAAGRHEFPGGKLEPGEDPAAAAARETREEAGIAVTIGRLLDTRAAASRTGPLEVLFFAAAPVDAAARPRPPFAWLPIAALSCCRFPPANDRVLALLAAGTVGSGAACAARQPDQGGS